MLVGYTDKTLLYKTSLEKAALKGQDDSNDDITNISAAHTNNGVNNGYHEEGIRPNDSSLRVSGGMFL